MSFVPAEELPGYAEFAESSDTKSDTLSSKILQMADENDLSRASVYRVQIRPTGASWMTESYVCPESYLG